MSDDGAGTRYGPFGTVEKIAEERYRTMIRLANIQYLYRGHVLRVVVEHATDRPSGSPHPVVIPGYDVSWVAYQNLAPSTAHEIERDYIRDEESAWRPKVFRQRQQAIDAGVARAAAALDSYLQSPNE